MADGYVTTLTHNAEEAIDAIETTSIDAHNVFAAFDGGFLAITEAGEP